MTQLLKKGRDISKEIDLLVEKFADQPKGTLLTYENIEAVCGVQRRTPTWGRVLKHFRNRLNDQHDRWCITVTGVGLRYANDNEERLKTEADRLERQAVRRLNKAAKCLGGIADTNLTDEERMFRDARLKQLAESKQVHRKHAAQRQSWLASPQTLPRVTWNDE